MRFIFVILLVLASSQWASSGIPNYVLCKNLKQVRTIRVVPNADQSGCRTAYTKSGKDKVIGTARNTESCLGFLNSVKSNLEQAHWKCRDISHAKLSVSESSIAE